MSGNGQTKGGTEEKKKILEKVDEIKTRLYRYWRNQIIGRNR